MKQLDAYIFWKYIKSFFFVALLLTMIATVFDFSEKIDDFLKQSIPIKQILFDHYLNFLPYINGQIWMLYAMITVIFFTSRMAFNTEIIAMLAAGVSFTRILRPYLIAAGLLSVIYFVANHYIIPIANKGRLNFEHTYISEESERDRMNNVHMFIEPETKIFARYFSKSDTAIRDFMIERFAEDKLVFLLKASKAEWLGPPNRWRLRDYEIRTFNELEETLQLGRNEYIDTTLNLNHQDFVFYENSKQGMTTFELQRFIKRERQRGIGNTQVFEVEMHRRTAEPFTVLILTVIGMAIASRKVRGGRGLHIVLGILLGATYIFLSKFTITFASSDVMPPLLGVWMPNILFTGVAIWLVKIAQK
jgi:lipopolysaccharide export system permease protein